MIAFLHRIIELLECRTKVKTIELGENVLVCNKHVSFSNSDVNGKTKENAVKIK